MVAAAEPETLLLCEHDPVVTLGRHARAEHILWSDAALRARGVQIAHATRGGDVTYHGPGQLVGYPIFRLVHGLVFHLEATAAAIVSLLASFDIQAHFRRDRPGVWVGDEKICAFGVHVSRRVAIHGFALNVHTDLDAFDAIVPCGLADARPTSMARLKAAIPAVDVVAHRLAHELAISHGIELAQVDIAASAIAKQKSGPIE